LILGLLAEHGPRHGHQLRRDAELAEVDRWAGVGVGSLHRELRSLEAAGLIEAVRTERVGRRPERTVYRLADAGRRELTALRQQAAGQLDAAPDPLSVLLVFAGNDDPAERAEGEQKGYLLPSVSPLQAASFRRAEMRIAAELAWHEECEELLGSGRRP
jgi:DNA-binding PadR family transcriptional regulator